MPPKRKNLSTDVEDKQAKTMRKYDPKSRIETESSNKPKSDLEPVSVQESNITRESGDGGGSGGGGGNDVGNRMDSDESAIGDPGSSLADDQALMPALSSDFVDHVVAVAKQELLSRQVVDLTASPTKEPGTSPSQDSPDSTKKSAPTSNAPVRTSQRLSSKVIPSSQPTAVSSSEPTSGQRTVAPLPSATGLQKNVTPPSQSSQKYAPRNLHFYNSKPRANAKGNIVYERMPSGEVIASLIRKPEAVHPGKVHPGNTGGNFSNRHTQVSVQGSREPTALPTLSLEHCPFNEYNIGEVLEKSIKATGSMRMLLTSLRDDLQRLGTRPTTVGEEQARKRQEVADKLKKAYATYRHSVEDVDPLTLLKSGAAGQGAAVIRGPAQKLPEAARPVMLVRNDAAARLTMQPERRKTDAVDGGKFSSREVIELSESEDEIENTPNNSAARKELDPADKAAKRDRPI